MAFIQPWGFSVTDITCDAAPQQTAPKQTIWWPPSRARRMWSSPATDTSHRCFAGPTCLPGCTEGADSIRVEPLGGTYRATETWPRAATCAPAAGLDDRTPFTSRYPTIQSSPMVGTMTTGAWICALRSGTRNAASRSTK